MHERVTTVPRRAGTRALVIGVVIALGTTLLVGSAAAAPRKAPAAAAPKEGGEITYGLERLAMYLQGVDNVYNLKWTEGLSYGDVYKQNEVEQSTYNFEHSDADFLFAAFAAHEKQARHLMEQQLALPAYEQALKASHIFNLLDARGVISPTERQSFIARVRDLAKGSAEAWEKSQSA